MSCHKFPLPDIEELKTWVYPTNYTVRNYQQQICEAALFQNTLVCLPTGLGKTLIAAVVMYNFHRWYPSGKIVFVAPTRPLVTQQITACHKIVGIPEIETAHLEGSVPVERRVILWGEKSVFFCTPQTFANDLQNGNCNARDIVCVVVDEAHKATQGFAYTIAVSVGCNLVKSDQYSITLSYMVNFAFPNGHISSFTIFICLLFITISHLVKCYISRIIFAIPGVNVLLSHRR